MYCIIVNPVAERGRSILRLPILTALLDAANIAYETHITTAPMDGYEKTLGICRRHPNCDGILIIGGDGTVQEVVAGMVDAFPSCRQGQKLSIPLGIIPVGTGNDFTAALEGGKYRARAKYRRDPEVVSQNFLDMLLRGRRRAIDVITAGGMGFVNIGHVGIDATIAVNASKLKFKYDEYAYWWAAVRSMKDFKNISLTIETADEKMEGIYSSVAVCNGQYYGAGVRLAPSARVDDGKITLSMLKPMGSRLISLISYICILIEKHGRVKNLSTKLCDGLKLTLPPTILCLDGNTYPWEGEVEFKILPGILEIFV